MPQPSRIPELQHQFRNLRGQARFDDTTRWIYSTDASIYQIQPLGAIIPDGFADLQQTLEIMQQEKLSLIARGGGTSLGGQAIGAGLQLDLAPHFSRILEVNPEAGWARVQPGVILDQLNQALAPYQMWFGPDVAPSNRATIGGMIGNNSAGAHSILYGKTQDHIVELSVLLADGSRIQCKDLDPRAWQVKARQKGLEGQIYQFLDQMALQHRAEIEKRFPKIMRRVSGYNLEAFLAPKPRNLAQIFAGSEGTLGLIYEAKVKIVHKPRQQGLLVLYFDTLADALEANHAILETQPAAAELMDKMLLDLTRQSPAFARKLYFMEHEANVLLMVEYMAESPTELSAKLEQAQRFAQTQQLGFHQTITTDPRVQADIWAIRKAGMPLLYSRPGDYKPITFIEDTAVAPEKLKDFIQEFEALIQSHDTQAAYYAHASVGCLHIRPLIDLKQASEVRKMRSLAEGVLELVQRYHGAMSGEHGDGLARSEFNERLFGPEIYRLFQQLKQTCDPEQRFNPGKIVNAPPMDQNLRYGEAYQPQPFTSFLQYPAQESFQNLVELCNGNGACRKLGSGTMCPPYQVTRQEQDSTRGRANALRRLLLQPELDALGEQELHQVMDLCIGCKACKSECPSKVDMAKLKSEYLYQHQQKHGVPLRSKLFGQLKWLNHFGSLTAPLSNQALQFAPLRRWMQNQLGIDASKALPPFAAIPFDYRLREMPEQAPDRPAVLLFNDCYMNYNHPEVGLASHQILRAFGYRVIVLPQHCCGRPLISLGLLDQAKRHAQRILNLYEPWLDQGLQVVGAEPSCLLSFRDEFPDFWPAASQKLKAQSLTLQEWIYQESQKSEQLPFKTHNQEIFFHEHCHQKSLVGSEITEKIFAQIPGLNVNLSTAGCCGMAGSFGYEAEHAEISHKITQDRLVPGIKSHPQAELGVSGVSCRQQIVHESGRPVRHLAEILADALKPEQLS